MDFKREIEKKKKERAIMSSDRKYPQSPQKSPEKNPDKLPQLDPNAVPFESTIDAWFWFILAQQARNEGARYTSGMSLTPRPCEPMDILKILDGLYRKRMLLRDHLLILRHYGRRQMAPDPRRAKEVLADKLWQQALERIEPVLIRKGIVRAKKLTTKHPNKFWACGATVHINLNISADGTEGLSL